MIFWNLFVELCRLFVWLSRSFVQLYKLFFWCLNIPRCVPVACLDAWIVYLSVEIVVLVF